jgi:hypothetical protein
VADGASNEGHDTRGRFTAGNPGGPGGARRRRSAELRRAVEEAITPEHAQAMIRKATRLALEGDLAAMRLVFERTLGRAAEAPAESEALDIQLPNLQSASDCNVALQRLVDAVCQGKVERETATLLIQAIQAKVKAIETTIELPKLETMQDCALATTRIMTAIGEGHLTLDAGRVLLDAVQGQARILGHHEPDARSPEDRGRALLDALQEMKQRGGLEPA